jgi:hypothetical protein
MKSRSILTLLNLLLEQTKLAYRDHRGGGGLCGVKNYMHLKGIINMYEFRILYSYMTFNLPPRGKFIYCWPKYDALSRFDWIEKRIAKEEYIEYKSYTNA